jgi:hypothetical protein
MPRSIRKYPLLRREPVAYTPCDRAFESAEKVYKKAGDALGSAASVCLHTVGVKLLAACAQFDQSDSDLKAFMGGLRSGLASRDFVTIGTATRVFLSTIDRSKVNWSDEQDPETAITGAVLSYSDALENWAEQKYQESYSSTVRCRASLTRIGD